MPSAPGPDAPVRACVDALFRRVLRLPHVAPDADFFELGGDSLQATELLTELDELTGMDLELQTLYAHPSVAALVAHIEADPRRDSHFNLAREFARPERAAGARATPNLVLLRQGDVPSALGIAATPGTPGRTEAPALFCIHPGDGGSSMYLPLVRTMRTRPSVYAFVAWDLRRREWPRSTVQAIAADYVAQLRDKQPAGPYHLFGWSSGAVIAYEMAQQLEAQGQRVGLLGMVDPFEAWESERADASRSLPLPDAPFTDDDWRVAMLMFVLDDCIEPPGHAFWRWPETQRFEWVCERARRIGRFPPSMTAETFAYLCRVVRQHCLAYDCYKPTRGHFDMTLFLPHQRDAADLNASYWPALTDGACALVHVGGDHLSMMRLPHVVGLAQAVDRVFAAP